MPLEFIARNGVIALASSTISGSLTVTNGITGSLLGTATTASYILSAISSSFASTASYADNFTVGNTLTAQRIVVQTISSSVVFSSGSNRFGNDITNTQSFTGSVGITGSLTVAGNILPSPTSTYTLGSGTNQFSNIWTSNGVISTLFTTLIRASGNSILFGSNQTNYWGGFIGNSSTSSANLILTYTSSAGLGGDNGYKLQIYPSGSASGSLFVSGSSSFTGSVNISGITTISGDILPSVDNTISLGKANSDFNTVWTRLVRSSASVLSFRADQHSFYSGTSNTEVLRIIGTSANLLIQNGGTFTDNGYRLQVNGSGSASGSLYVNGLSTFDGIISGSFTANNPSSSLIVLSGSIQPSASLGGASAMYVNTVLSASANSQTLVGLDINPTFNSGSFTGVLNYLIRAQAGGSNKFLIDTVGNMGFGTTIPSRHTETTYPGIFLGNSNSSIMGEPGGGYKGILLNANIVRNPSYGWTCQDTTQPGWAMALSYDTGNTDNFSIVRTPATSTYPGFVTLFQIKGTGNVLINSTTDAGYRLDVSGSTRLNGPTTIKSASLDYQQNLAVATGSFQTIVSAATGSYRSAFFDYVAYSASVVRAGTVISTWSGSNTEYFENYTGDLGGSTSVVTLQTAISASNIVLQAGISGSAWSVRSLVRLL